MEDNRIAELNLKETVRELSFMENPANLAILFEITGYQAEIEGDEEFWANYESYKLADWNQQMAIN